MQSALEAGDLQAVARMVVAGTSTRIRQAAAQAIEEPDLLRQLIRDVRGGNDKSVYKILTAKRDAQLEQARQLEALRVEIDAAAADLERHSQRVYDALFGPRLEQFERRWAAVAEQADAELRGRVQQWIERSRETAAEHQRELDAQAAREQAAADAAAEARRLREEQAQAAAAIAAEQERVREEGQGALAEQQQTEPHSDQNLDQNPHQNTDQSPDQNPGQNPEQKRPEPQPDQQAVRQIGEMIRKARAALGGGSTSRAAGLRREVEQALALEGAPTLPAKLVSQLQQLDQQLDELKDWKSFSVAPKRAELIEEMESLIGAPLEPQALADRIKSLKDGWRTLRKGAGEPVEADEQRFQEAAKKAFEPCTAYFAAQAVVLKENLQRREAVLARLTAFEAEYDWEKADWRAVVTTLREAKEEWRGCAPVDRRAGKTQQDSFMALTARLQERVDAAHASNVQRKESLIARAAQALASDDVRKAIDAIKKLQQEWQAVGPVPRALDQRLWGEFRGHCDAVFQKRQQESEAFKEGLEGNKTQALALCEQVEAIAALDGPELLEGVRGLSELRSAFAALGEFPRAESSEIRSRFERGLDRCKAAVARKQARAAERSWSDLFEAANHVRAYRLAVARGADAEQTDTLKVAAETFIAAIQKWPKGGLDALQQGLVAEGSADLAANETALRMLCIRAEILADVPTPPEDQALRRDYQLQRLVQGLGQGVREDDAQLDSLALEWLGVGPVEEAAYQPLLQRFRRCREAGSAKA